MSNNLSSTGQVRPSPSPSPVPSGIKPKPINVRASLQPSSNALRATGQQPISPRPLALNSGAGRPASELLHSATNMAFQTPEVDAIDQWFENLQNYETTLEEMAAASQDANFKEELSAIEQWFRVLSEAERTAAMYSLLQHSTPMQIRFFITVLQQMARADPMTALLSPNAGASMQSQMEAKLASLGLKSPAIPQSPGPRALNSSLGRQPAPTDAANFLSPESANGSGIDAAATLAQQRARLKANASHRISAPGTLSQFAAEGGLRSSGAWSSSQLGQVVERSPSPAGNEGAGGSAPSPRPKSTDFAGVANSFRSARLNQVQSEGQSLEDQLSPMVGGNWASMSNTPVVPMFGSRSEATGAGQDAIGASGDVASKLASWNLSNNTNGRMVLDDARKFRRVSGNRLEGSEIGYGFGSESENANTLGTSGRTTSATLNSSLKGPQSQTWGSQQRSPALSSTTRFGGDVDNESFSGSHVAAANLAALGAPNPQLQAQMMALAQAQMGLSPGLNMFGNLNGLSPLAMNGMVSGVDVGLNQIQQAQLLAAQMAASGFHPGFAALGTSQHPRRGAGSGRSPSNKPSSGNGRSSADKKDEEEVDPSLLEDVPAWLRSLRLHKYTPNFQGATWREMVAMDEAQLEAKGVAALGARRKLLKTFELVRSKMGIEVPAAVGSPQQVHDEGDQAPAADTTLT